MIYPTDSSKPVSFSKRYYIPVAQRNFIRLQIYIRDKSMDVPSIITEDLQLTLHLKKNIKINKYLDFCNRCVQVKMGYHKNSTFTIMT